MKPLKTPSQKIDISFDKKDKNIPEITIEDSNINPIFKKEISRNNFEKENQLSPNRKIEKVTPTPKYNVKNIKDELNNLNNYNNASGRKLMLIFILKLNKNFFNNYIIKINIFLNTLNKLKY